VTTATPSILGVVGFSGSGKTTLIEALVPELRGRGLRVGVLKHDAHRIELDRPGKDSYRIRQTGADAVAIASSEVTFLTIPTPPTADPEELVRVLFGGLDLDLVLLEGYSGQDHPKVQVLHPQKGRRVFPGAPPGGPPGLRTPAAIPGRRRAGPGELPGEPRPGPARGRRTRAS